MGVPVIGIVSRYASLPSWNGDHVRRVDLLLAAE